MRITDRIKRDRKMLTFLATPAKHEDGSFLKNSKDELVYPSLRDASEEFDMSEEHISRTKNKNIEEFERIKAEILNSLKNV